jgi:hypothetical protein
VHRCLLGHGVLRTVINQVHSNGEDIGPDEDPSDVHEL